MSISTIPSQADWVPENDSVNIAPEQAERALKILKGVRSEFQLLDDFYAETSGERYKKVEVNEEGITEEDFDDPLLSEED